MRRLLQLRTPALALLFSVVAEALSFIVAVLARTANDPDHPVIATRFLDWFHSLPFWLVESFFRTFKPFYDSESFQAQLTRLVLEVLFAVAQWFLIFLVGIGLFRRFYLKKA
jgi:hypothetical protein